MTPKSHPGVVGAHVRRLKSPRWTSGVWPGLLVARSHGRQQRVAFHWEKLSPSSYAKHSPGKALTHSEVLPSLRPPSSSGEAVSPALFLGTQSKSLLSIRICFSFSRTTYVDSHPGWSGTLDYRTTVNGIRTDGRNNGTE